MGIERSFEPWNRAHLVPDVIPTLDGMAAGLEAGAKVADIGCGAGGAVLMLAAAFPASTFTGYDISQHALDPRRTSGSPSRASTTPRSSTRGRARCRTTARSTS